MPLFMASSIPKASCCYPDRYDVTISGAALKHNAEQNFTLHPNKACAAIQYVIENILFCPLSCALQSYSHSFSETIFGSIEPMPFPGQMGQFSEEDKRKKICRDKIACVAIAPLAAVSFCLAMPARAAFIKTRPFLQVIQKDSFVPEPPPKLTFAEPGNFATANIAFPPNCARIAQNITSSLWRAVHLATSILNDPLAASFYCIQEDWDRQAMRVFANIVSVKYIVAHSFGPSVKGMPAGCAFLSRYPLLEIRFHKLRHMVMGQDFTPRGISSATIATQHGFLSFYNFHMQSFDGEEPARARAKQFEDLGAIMEADRREKPGLLQIAMGDGNCPPIDMWGRKNDNQMEGQALRKLATVLDQPFFDDHHRLTGKRTKGQPHFLNSDNARMAFGEQIAPFPTEIMGLILSYSHFQEPQASWYLGPYHPLPQQIEADLQKQRAEHGYPAPEQVGADRISNWGTPAWFDEQRLDTATYEVVGLPKGSPLSAQVEIRRHVTTREIGPLSDHAIMQGRFWIKPQAKPHENKMNR